MDSYLSNKDGNRVSPATEDKLEEVRLYLQRFLESPGGECGKSYLYRNQKITIGADSLGRGTDQPCKNVWVTTDGQSGVQVGIDDPGDDDNADANCFLVGQYKILELAVTNCNRLRFYGTSGDNTYILARL